nr:MAG TPA: hypothetical protein [Caudoviricetes sp.]
MPLRLNTHKSNFIYAERARNKRPSGNNSSRLWTVYEPLGTLSRVNLNFVKNPKETFYV